MNLRAEIIRLNLSGQTERGLLKIVDEAQGAFTYEKALAWHTFTNPNQGFTDGEVEVDTFTGYPIEVKESITLEKVALYIDTVNAGTLAVVGIYKVEDTGLLGEVVFNSTEIDTTTIGLKEVNANVELSKGTYIVGVLANGFITGRGIAPSGLADDNIVESLGINVGDFPSQIHPRYNLVTCSIPYVAILPDSPLGAIATRTGLSISPIFKLKE